MPVASTTTPGPNVTSEITVNVAADPQPAPAPALPSAPAPTTPAATPTAYVPAPAPAPTTPAAQPRPKQHPVVKHHRVVPAHRAAVAFATPILKPFFTSTAPQPLSPAVAAPTFVPAQGVRLVPPTDVPVSSAMSTRPAETTSPPKAPTLPSAPNAPVNDSPISFGGALSGPAGGAILLFAALAATLLIIPPWLTSRVAMAVAVPVEYRRRLSLERPG